MTKQEEILKLSKKLTRLIERFKKKPPKNLAQTLSFAFKSYALALEMYRVSQKPAEPIVSNSFEKGGIVGENDDEMILSSKGGYKVIIPDVPKNERHNVIRW